jgi:hypothetical protein
MLQDISILDNKKSDPSNNLSFKACLLRVSASYNYKCLQSNNGIIADSTTHVKKLLSSTKDILFIINFF